jgi:hypothetical protein
MDKRLVLSICAAAGCLAVLSLSTAAGFRGVLKTETPRRLHRSVKDVVLAVANNQIRSLSDGKYAGGTWDQVRDIQGTSGVVWNYPWGVVLYGLLRASESTDDRAFSDFVVRHDQIRARLHFQQDAAFRIDESRPSRLLRCHGRAIPRSPALAEHPGLSRG